MRKALYILLELNDQDISWLAASGTRQTIPPGTEVITAGEPVDMLSIVIDGNLAVVLDADTEIARLSTGDILGEMSFIETRPPTVSVRTLSQTRLLCIPHEKVRIELMRNLGFAARFYRAVAIFLSDRMRSTVGQLGYGAINEQDTFDTFARTHELDDGVLDGLHIAGDRMLRLIAVLEGHRV